MKALFLDRDGVINKDIGYLCSIDKCEFIDGIFELCRDAIDKGYNIFIVTNQAGIARGYYTEEEFLEFSDWMNNVFLSHGINITKLYYCPHHPDFTGHCDCRKPNPGMLIQAIREYNIDPSKSIMIGDKDTDMEAAEKAGIINRYMIDSTKNRLLYTKL